MEKVELLVWRVHAHRAVDTIWSRWGRPLFKDKEAVRESLRSWLHARAQAGAGASAGPLFLPMVKGGRIRLGRLDSRTVLDIAQKRARQAGVKHLTPHDFRRTMIGDLLDAGADISTVQRLAGHAQVTTTARYDRRGEVAKARAAELLHIPIEE